VPLLSLPGGRHADQLNTGWNY